MRRVVLSFWISLDGYSGAGDAEHYEPFPLTVSASSPGRSGQEKRARPFGMMLAVTPRRRPAGG